MRSTAPSDLRRGPFTVVEARELGIRWKTLQRNHWTRLSRGQYAWAGLPQDAFLKLRAVLERMPIPFAFSGPTAGWLHRLDLAPCDPIEVTVDRDLPVRARAGVRVRRAALPEMDVVIRRGLPTTSPLRTVRDLGSRRDLTDAVIAVDMALHAGLVDLADLSTFVHANPGTKGITRLRRVVGLADAGAASPMETRLRLALLTAGLPRPCSQAELTDGAGRMIARVDLYYADRRLAIEYDGENHKVRMAADLKRQNAMVNSGYHILRFTAADVAAGGTAAAQVRRAREILAKPIR